MTITIPVWVLAMLGWISLSVIAYAAVLLIGACIYDICLHRGIARVNRINREKAAMRARIHQFGADEAQP